MGFYDRHILPRLLDWACGARAFARQRARVVPYAKGRVLELGVGTGRNFHFYDPTKIEQVIALDPAEDMLTLAKRRAGRLAFPVKALAFPGEVLPLPDACVDTVVVTYALCTIPDAAEAMRHMRRVLRPGGELLFLEHGRAPEARMRDWQRRLGPAWRRIFGGCHLDRDIPALIAGSGFRMKWSEEGYIAVPRLLRIAGYNYWGAAEPA
jgi:ubiquinone/menaquinone biosynthesis C-methylase UbiE